MKLLLDENVDARLADVLAGQGHDATAIARDYPHALDDSAVLQIARNEERLLLTNDRDFGGLVFRQGQGHHGIVFFRLSTTDLPTLTTRLTAVLTAYAEQLDQFLVVTDQRVRVRSGEA